MSSVNNSIPFVPENTIDPAAGLNEAINTIDALLQLLVVSVGTNAPPGSPAVGARYIVGPAPTGAWASQANKLARWLDGGWTFFNARYALNATDGLWYVRPATTWAVLPGGGGGSASWATLSGIPPNVLALAALAGAPDVIAYFTGDGMMGLASFTASARTLLAATDAEAQRLALGLGNVDNTSDANKPVSTAQQTALDGKVDKVPGLGLSQNDFTDALYDKLSSIEGSKFQGLFVSLVALSTAIPVGEPGWYAWIDPGTGGVPTEVAIWDVDDAEWFVTSSGGGGSMTPSQVKSALLANPDTNVLTDAELAKLGGIESGAQVNVATNLQQGARTATTVVVESSTGTDATLASASTTEAGLMAASDKVRLNGSERTLTPGAGITIDRTNPDAPVIRATGGGTGLPYVSPQQIITSGAELSLTHGLGAAPALTSSELVCTDAEHGYSIGDTIALAPPAFFNAASNGFSLRKNSTNIIVRFGSAAGVFIYVRATDGVAVTLTNARWRLIVRAWA